MKTLGGGSSSSSFAALSNFHFTWKKENKKATTKKLIQKMFFFFNSRIILIIFILQDIQGIARFIFSCLARFVAHTYMLRRFLFLLTPTGPGLTKGEGGGVFLFSIFCPWKILEKRYHPNASDLPFREKKHPQITSGQQNFWPTQRILL